MSGDSIPVTEATTPDVEPSQDVEQKENENTKFDQGYAAWIEVAEDKEGYWHWCLWSGNGRQMATNASAYESRSAAISAVRSVAVVLRKDMPIIRSHKV